MTLKILDAVEVFYNSVGDAYDYGAALRAYSAVIDDTGVACSEFNPFTRKVTIHAAHGLEQQAMEGWHATTEKCDALNALVKAAIKIPVHVPAMRRTFVPDEIWERSATYRLVSAPWRYHDDGTSILSRSIFKIVTCGFARLPDQRPLDPEELAAMAYMNRHFARAMTLQYRLSDLERALIETNSVLDLIEFGLVMFGGNRRIEFVNASARRIFDANDGMSLNADTLKFEHTKNQTQLNIILDQIYSDNVQRKEQVGGLLRVPRRSGWSSYKITIIPTHDGHLVDASIKAVGFIFDPRKKQTSAVAVLSKTYGFTPAEAALADELMQGQTLASCAQSRGVSYNTMKTHLHAIFSKTQTKRQAELVSLLFSTIAGMSINQPKR